MLIEIRDRASGIVAYFIVGLLVVSFALWGVHEYFGTGANPEVATVNGLEITKREFDNRLQEQTRYLRSVLGNSFDQLYEDEDTLKKQTLDGLIMNAVLDQGTEQSGYRVSDTSVLEHLQSLPYFQTNGRFDVKRYEQQLAAQRIPPENFEQQLRQEQRVNQFRTSVGVSSFLTADDKKTLGALSSQKRDFSFVQIPLRTGQTTVSEDEIAEFYAKNKQQYQQPAQAKLEYLEIDQTAIASEFSVSEEDIRLEYEADPERFRSDELRKVRRILLKTDEQADESQVQKQRDILGALIKRIEQGEDFAKLASEYSEDKFSAANGGDLGFISVTEFDDPEFNKTVFDLSVGEISQPVRTRFGMQIIQVMEVQTGELKTFEQAKVAIEEELRNEFAQKEYYRLVEDLDHLTYEHDDTLSVAAEQLDLKVQQTEWVSEQSDQGIMSSAEVREVAFSNDLIERGLNSQVIELDHTRALVLRVVDYKEATPLPLDNVKAEVAASLKSRKARAALQGTTQAWLQQLRSGEISLDAVASQAGVEVRHPGPLLRDDAKVAQPILNTVFSMAAPADDQAVYETMELEDGDFVVLRLDQIIPVEDAAHAVEAGEWVVQQTNYGRRELDAVMNAMRDAAKVRLYPENM